MRSPDAKEWEELPDGSLRYISTMTHTDTEVLIIPVQEKKPILQSRVFLAWRHRETGAITYWKDKSLKYLKPRVLSLRVAILNARTHYRDSGKLLEIGVT